MATRNSIDLDRDPRSIVGTRVLAAPRALVFSVWTDPKHLVQWWGPNGFRTTTHAFDFRPGGIWRFVMHGPDGRNYQNRITFDEIVAPERIVYRHDGAEDVGPVTFTQTVSFEDIGNGETRLTWHGKFPSAEERARHPGIWRRQRPGSDNGAARRLSGSARHGAHVDARAAKVRRAIAAPRADHLRFRAESIVQFPHGSASTADTLWRAGRDPWR